MATVSRTTSEMTLLIVEDDILPALALQEELRDAGYRVLEITGRRDHALVAAREHKPDLALVNIELQGRDDGIALAEELKAMGIPTLFISGRVIKARSAHTVAIASLPKPYRTTDVVISVAYLLRHLKGDESLPRPRSLEIFDQPATDPVPDPV